MFKKNNLILIFIILAFVLYYCLKKNKNKESMSVIVRGKTFEEGDFFMDILEREAKKEIKDNILIDEKMKKILQEEETQEEIEEDEKDELIKGFVVTKQKKGSRLGDVKNRIGNYKFEKEYNKVLAFTNGKYKIFYGSGNDGWQWVRKFNQWAGDGPSIDKIKTAKDFANFKGFVVESSEDKDEKVTEDKDEEVTEDEVEEEVTEDKVEEEILEDEIEEIYGEDKPPKFKDIIKIVQEEGIKKLPKKLKQILKKSPVIKKSILGQVNPSGYFEEKDYSLDKILELTKEYLEKCSIDDIKLKPKVISKLKNRKELIEILPLLKIEFRSKIKYDDIKCLVKKYDSKNFINNHKIQRKLPIYFPHKNSMIINGFLYHYTAFGVIKYKLKKFADGDKNNDIINGSFESTILNDINLLNNKDKQIFPYRGKILFIKENKIFNLLNNKEEDIKEDTIIENPEEEIIYQLPENKDDFLNRLLFVISINNISFFIRPNKITPEIGIANKINKFINSHNLILKGIVPQIFYLDKKLHIRYLFITTNSFYFILNKDNLSELKDFKEDFGLLIYDRLDYPLNCDDNRLLLNQMVISKLISKDKRKEILQSLKC